MRNRIHFPAIATALLLISALAAAKAWAAPLNPNSWIRISAFTDQPLAGADVAIFGTDGQLLFEQLNATNDRGIYPAKLTNMPRNFRVVVARDSNGQVNLSDLRSRGTVVLSADVRNYNPESDVVYVNPVTTIVTGVLLRHPEFNLEQAQARVRRFLGMPVNASLGAALRESPLFHPAYFSESGFLKQAKEHGGLVIYVENLLNQMLSNSGAVHTFPSTVLQSGTDGVVLQSSARLLGGVSGIESFIAKGLINGALSYGGGQGVGWVMQAAGLSEPGATADQIMQLQQSLDALQSSVDQLKQQQDLATQQILAELTKTQYNTISTQAIALASDVNTVEKNLDFYVQGCPPLPGTGTMVSTGDEPDGWCANQRAIVLSQLTDIQINGSFERLAVWLEDTQSVSFHGMIHLFSQAAGQSVRFFRPADSTRVQNMFDYWDSVETQAANLKVELYHLNCDQDCIQKNPGAKAQITDFLGNPDLGTTGTFQATNAAEQKLMKPPVPIDTVINTKDRTMWLTSYPSILTYNACYGAPPAGGAANYPITQYYPLHPPQTFLSPTLDQANALIYGWTGSSPNQWLIDQSKAVAPDSPVSAGFPNIVAATPPSGITCTAYPTIWTQTRNGTANIYGVTYAQYYIVNLGAGPNPAASWGATRYPNWEFLVRTLDAGEQYYWYPEQ